MTKGRGAASLMYISYLLSSLALNIVVLCRVGFRCNLVRYQ